MKALLKRNCMNISEKVVLRLTREQRLRPQIKCMGCYSSYKGEISPSVPSLINRNFYAPAPNEKWLTDITEFAIPAGKVYLSAIIDCYDGIAVSWKIGRTAPDALLTNDTLDKALGKLSIEHPILHSDRGCHYR